jgi:putative nucleotidyltransferase with HDIG domain
MNWQKLKQASLDDIVAWAETQPWCQSMANCDQDAQWHSEGDVWTHTKMVCQQLTELEQWPSLADHERTVLIFTALLHDAAKPITSQTDAETGRITSPNHAVKGEHVARGMLRDLGCDLVTREQITRLVSRPEENLHYWKLLAEENGCYERISPAT